MLIKGKWTKDWQPVQSKDNDGRFVRQLSSFRNWITTDGKAGATGESGFKAEKDRYHLYIGLICPWACRTLMVRNLKKLENLISVTVVNPSLTDQGWCFGNFPGAQEDLLNNATYAHEIYTKADPQYTGRATVPILWDKKRQTIVNNESADIIRMLNSAFNELSNPSIDLYPQALATHIDSLNTSIYKHFSNGVYQAGFASTQQAYDEAVEGIFKELEQLEERLSDGKPFLLGQEITEVDICLFVTLIRFDVAYYSLFKCNIRHITDYKYLNEYMNRVFQISGIQETVNINHIKTGYYSIKALNPSGIIPKGPETPYNN